MESSLGHAFKDRIHEYFTEDMCFIFDDVDYYLRGEQVDNFKDILEYMVKSDCTVIMITNNPLVEKELQSSKAKNMDNSRFSNKSDLSTHEKTRLKY